MVLHAEDYVVRQELAEGEKGQSNAEVDLKVTRGVHKLVLVRACATLTAACLVMGLAFTTLEPDQFHEAARVLSASTSQTENRSSSRFGKQPSSGTIKLWRPPSSSSVSAICVCNWDQTQVRLAVGGLSKEPGNPWINTWTAWLWRNNPCSCITATLRQYFPEGRELSCGYVRQDAVNTAIPCRGFTYSSTSLLTGQYECSGSPPTCSKQGFCQGNICWQTR